MFTKEDCNHLPDAEMRNVQKSLDDIEFSESDIMKLLTMIDTSKSPGPDQIHPRVLKECAIELVGPLFMLFRNSLNEGRLPQEWKVGNITPIFKKGSRADVSNYRPVSLTSICCKLFEKIIRNALLQHMAENKFMTDCQHGFVKGRSCTTQLLQVLDRWTAILDQGGSVDSIYLDFAKAFDTVPHRRLTLKLKSYGVGGHVLEWITDFLAGRKQRVTLGGAVSEWERVASGVPQGSVLGPVLFICYVNDMPETVKSMIYMYADDTKIGREVSCERDGQALQTDLDSLVQWAHTWQLCFNVDKCKIMHLGSKNSGLDYTMKHYEKGKEVLMTLQTTKEEKDLGIWITDTLKASKNVAQAVSKANRILGLIKRSFSYLDMHLVKQLYTVMVRPHLEYGNAVCHPQLKKDTEMLESVQHRATRLIPGFWKLSYEERLTKMKLPSLMYRRLRGDAIEVFKHLHGVYGVKCMEMLPLSQGSSTRGHSWKLQKRDCNTSLRAGSFGMRVVNFWNSLSEEVVQSPSVSVFKIRFDHFCGERQLQYSTSTELGTQALR